ncbi:alpha-galactosidase [Spirillospora sp. CA-253888]
MSVETAPIEAVEHSAAERLWLLRTPRAAYCVRLDADDVPRTAHWGAPLTLEQARSLPGHEGEELSVEGGMRFGPASVQIRHADGSRGVDWRFTGHRIDGGQLTLRMSDRDRPLEIELHYRVGPDDDIVERWTVLRNTGTQPIEVRRCDSAAWNVPALPNYRISHVVGEWGREFQPRRVEAPVGETVFTSRQGRTGHHASPWLMIDDGNATEESGQVWSAALAWSGSWRITLDRDPLGRARWTGGFGHEGLAWRLGPGEELTTPVFAGLFSDGGFGAASRAWHAHIRRHVLPSPERVRPVVYNSWEATGFDFDLPRQLRLAERAARLGAEVFVLDDGWFAGRRSDTAGLGDWWPDPDRFPDGLDPLIRRVRGLGMEFGLWVEPESVNPDSDLFRTRPDWVLGRPDRPRTTERNQYLLDFGRPEVAEWAFTWLDELLSGHDIGFLKWDMNRPVTEADDRDWLPYVRNLYAVIDRLRAAHPHVYLETCAGGGGRVDIGMLARSDQVWTSDDTDPVRRLAIQRGFGQLYPACTMGAWVTDSPNELTAGTAPLRFRFHTAMAGALGLGGDLSAWSDEDLAWAAMFVEQYKRIRPVVHGGDLYRPAEHAVQYVLETAGQQQSVVLMWRASALDDDQTPVRLRGLDPAGLYRDADTGAVHHGAVLLSHGLPRPPLIDTTSDLVHLIRVTD